MVDVLSVGGKGQAPFIWERPCGRDFWEVVILDFTAELWIETSERPAQPLASYAMQ